jgi:hypothetical protein
MGTRYEIADFAPDASGSEPAPAAVGRITWAPSCCTTLSQSNAAHSSAIFVTSDDSRNSSPSEESVHDGQRHGDRFLQWQRTPSGFRRGKRIVS